MRIYSQSCPLFVPLVEEGWLNGAVTRQIAERYLSPMKEKRIDTLILGCTHYPLLSGVIKGILGHEVKLVNSAEAVAREIKMFLKGKELDRQEKSCGAYQFYVTDKPEEFQALGERFIGEKIKLVKRVPDNV
ncbi:MAG: aspartate/glutamate racemase family protein [Candidatus Omnitrophica bacterium]|nr:aspartate/glutamate racemase family protein [Candidatus Omnitrophota bacterium]